jgi:hypothetical protein
MQMVMMMVVGPRQWQEGWVEADGTVAEACM